MGYDEKMKSTKYWCLYPVGAKSADDGKYGRVKDDITKIRIACIGGGTSEVPPIAKSIYYKGESINPNAPKDLASDPIWDLVSSSNKIVQVDFMITIMYEGDKIRLDVNLTLDPLEKEDPNKYKPIYIKKVIDFLHQNKLDEKDYTMNYILP